MEIVIGMEAVVRMCRLTMIRIGGSMNHTEGQVRSMFVGMRGIWFGMWRTWGGRPVCRRRIIRTEALRGFAD